MMLSSGEWGFLIGLLAIHWVPLLVSMWLWPIREPTRSIASVLSLIVGLASWIIVLSCLFVFTDVKSGGNMTGAAAYIIYAVVSLGMVPVVIIFAHVMAGRFAGFAVRRMRHA